MWVGWGSSLGNDKWATHDLAYSWGVCIICYSARGGLMAKPCSDAVALRDN